MAHKFWVSCGKKLMKMVVSQTSRVVFKWPQVKPLYQIIIVVWIWDLNWWSCRFVFDKLDVVIIVEMALIWCRGYSRSWVGLGGLSGLCYWCHLESLFGFEIVKQISFGLRLVALGRDGNIHAGCVILGWFCVWLVRQTTRECVGWNCGSKAHTNELG